ncbi:hypothetical protein ACOMHN_052559 [Nucella lapillus]
MKWGGVWANPVSVPSVDQRCKEELCAPGSAAPLAATVPTDLAQPRRYRCPFCGTTFTSRGGLSLHKTSVHLQRRFECRLCGKVLKRKENLMYHMRTHDRPTPPWKQCPGPSKYRK